MMRTWPFGLVGVLCFLGIAGFLFLSTSLGSGRVVNPKAEELGPAETSAGPDGSALTEIRVPIGRDASSVSRAGSEEADSLDPAAFEVRGHVVDSSGVGLAGLIVQLRRGQDVRVAGAPTGPGGSFLVEGAREGDFLSARGGGFVSVVGHRVVRGALATIVCDRGFILQGVVLSASRSPVEGARIVVDQGIADILRATDGTAHSALLPLDTHSDSSGHFELALPDPPVARVVRVLLSGSECLRVEVPTPPPEFLELWLAAERASDPDPAPGALIAGVVMGLDREPRSGWQVHAFGVDEPLELLRSRNSTLTGPDGRFELSDLVPGTYVVVAFDSVSLERTGVESSPAPSRNLLLTPTGTSGRPVSGFLRGRDGSLLGGVRVEALPEGFSASIPDLLDWVPRTVSDATGAFEFSQGLGQGVSLVFSGGGVARAVRSLTEASVDAAGVASYELTRLARVRLTFSDRPEGEAVEFRDAGGALLVSELRTSNVQLSLERIPWTGSSVVEVLVPEVASSLVVYRGAGMVGSRSVVLDLERTTEIAID